MERWLSGRKHLTANEAARQKAREFESPPLLHTAEEMRSLYPGGVNLLLSSIQPHIFPHAMSISSFQWSYSENATPHRSATWYIVAGLVVGVILVYSLATANYLFALITLMTTIIVFSSMFQSSPERSYEITGHGISVDGSFLAFTDCDSFAVVPATQDMHKIYVQPRKGMGSLMSIPIAADKGEKMRTFLLNHVTEDSERVGEPIAEVLMRILKL